MIIKINDLQSLTEKIFLHLKEINVDEIELEHDYYWEIPEEFLYDAQKEPSSFVMGQLTDDWVELGKVLNNHHDPLGKDFVILATILKAIGQNITG